MGGITRDYFEKNVNICHNYSKPNKNIFFLNFRTLQLFCCKYKMLIPVLLT